MAHLWIILTASLVAAYCSLLGSFLVLRRMSMLGDAISHAVLPGLVLAFLASGSRNPGIMLAGAALVGLLSTILIEFLSGKMRLPGDASTGLVFTFMFATGIILVSLFAGKVDIDQDCVLYGEIAYTPLDRVMIGDYAVPTAFLTAFFTLAAVVAFVAVSYKAFQITTFNPEFAATAGIRVVFWQYALMGAVSMVTVVSFEMVGAILVVAFLAVPAAAAFLVCKKLGNMLRVAVFFGVLSAVTGFLLARELNSSVSGAMSVSAGFIFLLCFLAYRIRQGRRFSPVQDQRRGRQN